MKHGTLCYIRRDGKTLMVHRNKREDDFHFGKYVAIGGKNEEGEDDETCARREVFEEAGLTINKLTKRATIIFRNGRRKFNGRITEKDYSVVVYFAEEFEGEPKKECEEGTLEWIADSELLKLPMHEGDKLFTPWLYGKDNGYFEAELFHEGDKLANHSVIFRQ